MSDLTESGAAVAAEPALEVRWQGRIRRFTPDQTIRIGSGIHAHIRDDGTAGLDTAHATLRVVDGVWMLSDHSRSGTRVAGGRIGTWIVDGPTRAALGVRDDPLRLELEPARVPVARFSSPVAGPANAVVTSLRDWRRIRESDSGLRLVIHGDEHEFSAEQSEVTVGSVGSCDVVVESPSPVLVRFCSTSRGWLAEPIAFDTTFRADGRAFDRPRTLTGVVRLTVTERAGSDHEMMVFAPGVASGRRRLLAG